VNGILSALKNMGMSQAIRLIPILSMAEKFQDLITNRTNTNISPEAVRSGKYRF
jgi:hypothetical protein